MTDQKIQWEQDHAEDFEIYNKYVERQEKIKSGEEVEEEEEEDEDAQPPVLPVFNEAEVLAKFDDKEENAIVQIPKEVAQEHDDDWPMDKDTEVNLILDYLEKVNGP